MRKKHSNKKYAPLAILLIIVALTVAGPIVYRKGKTQTILGSSSDTSPVTGASRLLSFDGSKGVFTAQSHGLTEVRIQYIPVSGENVQLVGKMKLVGEVNGRQSWTLQAPIGGILANVIFAAGYEGESMVSQIEYSHAGAPNIYEHLY